VTKPTVREVLNCKLCREMPVPSGTARRCAFDGAGEFDPDNWSCETLSALRQAAGESWELKRDDPKSFFLRYDDTSYAALIVNEHPQDVVMHGAGKSRYGPWRGGGMIAMIWYKHRGTVDICIRVDPRNGGMYPDAARPLTLIEAEAAIENLKLVGRIK
jgi:hypothetical protein